METFLKSRSQKTEQELSKRLLNYASAGKLNDIYYVYLQNVLDYSDGLTISFRAYQGIVGSGSVYLSLNSLPPKEIKKYYNQNLAEGDIVDNQIVTVIYDKNNEIFQLQNPSSSYTTFASNIIEDSSHRFVTDEQITIWNSKQDSLGYTPENVANKGIPNGYASLGVNGKIPLSQIPDIAGVGGTQVYVVSGSVERLALPSESLKSGDGAYEYSTGNSYIWDGTVWILTATPEWANINIDWTNVTNKPTEFTPTAHTHSPSEVGLGNVNNVTQIPLSYLDDDINLTSNSSQRVSTQHAVKTYVDNKIPSEIPALLNKINNLEACESIEMLAAPGSGSINKFYDLFDTTNFYSLGELDTSNTLLLTELTSGGTTAQVIDTSSFEVGQEVTIQSSASIERKVIVGIPDSTTLQFSSGVSTSYPASVTKIYRSNVEIDTVNKQMRFGKVIAFSDIPDRIDPNNVQQPTYQSNRIGLTAYFDESGEYLFSTYANVVYDGYLYKKTGDTFSILQGLAPFAPYSSSYTVDRSLTYIVSYAYSSARGAKIYKRIGDSIVFVQNLITDIECYAARFDSTGTYLIVLTKQAPYARVFKRSGDTFSLLTTLPVSGEGNACIFDPTDTYVYIVVKTSPYYYIFKRQGDSFSFITNLPSGLYTNSAWSPGGIFLFTNRHLYKRTGDTFNLISSSFPANTLSAAFSPNGLYLALTRGDVAPKLYIYKISGDTFNLLDTSTVPTLYYMNKINFSYDSKYLAVGGFSLYNQPPYLIIYKYISGDQDATEIDIRYKIRPSGKISSIFTNIQRNNIPGFNLIGYASTGSTENYQQLNKQTVSSTEDSFSYNELTPGDQVTLKIVATKASVSDNAYLTKILGGVR